MRMVRATMLEVLNLDYVRTARAKGVPRRTVLVRHALRNALIPVVTVAGFEVGVLISGAAVAEIIFGLPGVGYQLLHAIFQRDYPVVQASVLIIATTFVVVNFFVDLLFAFPLLVLAILIVGLLGPSRRNAMIAIGIVYAPAFARVIRAAALEVLGFPFIESARSLGANDLRIITRHILPNIVAPLIVLTTVYFSQAILGEAFLSFLGLGTQPPEAAWGNMLSTARNFIESSVWMSVFPGLAIMFAVLGFNFLGDGLRDVLDPRLGGVADEIVVKSK